MSSLEGSSSASHKNILVVEIFLPEIFTQAHLEEHIQDQTLEKLILCSVALNHQYSIQDADPEKLDAEAIEEIEQYKKEGLKLGCFLPNPKALTAIHIHAATEKEERRRYDACNKTS